MRQRILNWRRGFLDRAIDIAAAAAHQKFKMGHPGMTKNDAAGWADGAMNPSTGFALWEAPPTEQV